MKNMEQKYLDSLKISMKYHTTLNCLVSDFTRETYMQQNFKWLLLHVIHCYVRDKEELKSNIWKVVNNKPKPMSNSIYHPLYLLMDGVSLWVQEIGACF